MKKPSQVTVLLLVSGVGVFAQVRNAQDVLQQRARRLEPLFQQAGRRYGIESRILRTLCFLESRFRIDVVSPRGARGPMQFMPETARRYGLLNPLDPTSAIDAAARYLRDLLKRFDGRVDLAVAAYNAGEGAVEAFRYGRSIHLSNGKVINPGRLITGGIPPYRETQNYVRSAIALIRSDSPYTRGSESPFNFVTHINRDFSLDVLSIGKTKDSPNQAPSTFLDVEP